MGYAEVDQSGKVEQFNIDTVVALSNSINYAVVLPKKIKQEIFMELKGDVKSLKYKLFAILIYYCVKNFSGKENKIVICPEYPGKDAYILSEVARLLDWTYGVMEIAQITKKSPAHRHAISINRGTIKPDKILQKKDILKKI